MKKQIASIAAVSALALGGFAASANAADPYPVQPEHHVTVVHAGHTVTITFNSGIVGLPAKGKVHWTIVSGPKGFHTGKHGSDQLRHSKVTLGGKHAFAKPGIYKVKMTVGGKTYTVKIKAK